MASSPTRRKCSVCMLGLACPAVFRILRADIDFFREKCVAAAA